MVIGKKFSLNWQYRMLLWVIIFCIIAIPFASAQNTENLRITPQEKEGFGRIIFRLGIPIENYDVSLVGNVLNIEFAQPLTATFGNLINTLDDYVLTANINQNGTGITIILKNENTKVRKFKTANLAGVDLTPINIIAQPPQTTTDNDDARSPSPEQTIPRNNVATEPADRTNTTSSVTTPQPLAFIPKPLLKPDSTAANTAPIIANTIPSPDIIGPQPLEPQFGSVITSEDFVGPMPANLNEISNFEITGGNTGIIRTPVFKPSNTETFIITENNNQDDTFIGPPIDPSNLTEIGIFKMTGGDKGIIRTPLLKPDTISKVIAVGDEEFGPLTADEYYLSLALGTPKTSTESEPEDDWDGARALSWDDGDEEPEPEDQGGDDDFAALELLLSPEPQEEKKPEPEPVEAVEEESEEVVEEQEITTDFGLAVTTSKIKDGIRLTFPWEQKIAATVYERSEKLWVIFDKYSRIDVESLIENSAISAAEQVFHRNYTILKLNTKLDNNQPSHYDVYKDDFKWVVELKKGEHVPVAQSVDVVIDTKGIVPKILMPVLNTGEPLKLIDPDVGDRMVVIPLYRDRIGITPTRKFVDFSLLETHQGIVIPIRSDATFVRSRRDGITITKSAGLNIYTGTKDLAEGMEIDIDELPEQEKTIFPFDSTVIETAYLEEIKQRDAPLKEEGDSSNQEDNATENIEEAETEEAETEEVEESEEEDFLGALTISDETEEDEEIAKEEEQEELTFIEYKQMLFDDIIEAPDEEKTERRLIFAKFLFSHKYYAEARGVLQEAQLESKEQDSRIMQLLAASNYMLGQYVEAASIFRNIIKNGGETDGLEELYLWWWASNNQIRPKSWQTTEEIPLRYYKNHEGFIRNYPVSLSQNMGLLAAQHRFESGDIETTKSILELLEEEEGSDVQRNSARFIEAGILDQEGNIDGAIEIWETLSKDIEDRYNRARGSFALYKKLYTLNRMDKLDVIKKLDALRIVWKGDDFELELLKFLGGLYIFENDYLNGLRTWRELVTQFPKTQESLLIARQMKKTFIELFDKGKAYELEPFTALALYFEFRELTPVGTTGDRIIRQLVDHFVAADLLENAAALLTHQVRFRSKGEERVKLTIKLADIHLTNKRPDLTLEALDLVQQAELSEDTAEAYKYLKARALMAEKRELETLQLLRNDWTRSAQDLRLDIFLERQNWFGIMNITEPRLQEVIDRGDPIKGASLKDLILLSIAYATQQEYDKLVTLQEEFIDKIEDSNGRRIFAFVTNDQGSVNHLRFDNTVQLEDISSFVTNYLFWPSREWANVIEILEPEVATIKPSVESPLSQDETNQIIQLAIAYAMEIDTGADDEKIKNATKGLKRLQREFAKVEIDERSLPVFIALTQDPELIPQGALDKPTSIKNIDNFVNNYRTMIEGSDSVL